MPIARPIPHPITIGIVACEASGDALGAALMEALKKRLPGAKFVGVAGPKMLAQGATSWFPMERLAVNGLVEVLERVPEILKARRMLAKRMLAENVACFIGVDAPDFNLPLERRLKNARPSVKTIHFVSPTVWAWRPGRVKTVASAANLLLTLFPFEARYYEPVGMPCHYVGHPAAARAADGELRAAARAALGLSGAAPVFALLPGSRHSEIHYHAELLWRTMQKLRRALPEARFIAPMVSETARVQFLSLKPDDVAEDLPLSLFVGKSEEALRAADIALVCSGTATLETAMAGTPMVIFYRASPLSIWIVRRMIQVQWVGLPNLLAGREIVRELIQNDATPDRLADEALALVRHPDRRLEMCREFAAIAQSLALDTGEEAAKAVMEVLGASSNASTIAD